MRHTLKWSFFIGTAVAGAVIALLRIFQPIRYEHLVFFGYAFVGASVISGYVVHRNIEKRHKSQYGAKMENQNAKPLAANTDGGNAGAIGVQRIQICGDSMKDNTKKEKADVPEFVPASKLMNETEEAVTEPVTHMNGKTDGQYQAAEKLLDEIEEEAENETCKTETKAGKNNSHSITAVAGNNYFQHCGKHAKIFTSDGKVISGRFAGMDTHVVLEDAMCDYKKKILFMISKSEIARMEVE